MIDREVPLCHDLLEISIAEREPEVPADAQNDNLGFEVSSFEQRRPVRPHHFTLSNKLRPTLQHIRSQTALAVSAVFAALHRYREARVIADTCAFSPDKLSAYAAILKAYARGHECDPEQESGIRASGRHGGRFRILSNRGDGGQATRNAPKEWPSASCT